jgi:hypothetical protein
MQGKKLSPYQKEEILRLEREGWQQWEIGAKVGVSRVSVCKFLSRHNGRLYDVLVRKHAAERGRQLKKLFWMFREATEEWEKSKRPAVTVRVGKSKAGKNGAAAESGWAERITATRCGNPEFLSRMLEILATIREVLMMPKTPRRDEKSNPAAGDWDVTQALQEIAVLARTLEAEDG